MHEHSTSCKQNCFVQRSIFSYSYKYRILAYCTVTIRYEYESVSLFMLYVDTCFPKFFYDTIHTSKYEEMCVLSRSRAEIGTRRARVR